MIKQFQNAKEAERALQKFARENWAALPAAVKAEIAAHDGPGVSFVVKISRVAESLLAHRNKAGVGNRKGRILLGQLAAFAGGQGWHSWGDGRGKRALRAMEREIHAPLPEGATYQDEADDPAPLAEFSLERVGPDISIPPPPPPPPADPPLPE